ncbi:oligosaccharide flippase family protein [Spirosoma endophyticum]|uniref:Polysaccharide transporter, PST family n=1 Tax=Spirosoma endophyticum TaxID=662367 RepID=A0A1I2CA51_9BACT|nr:oligosaccharide flippase family protein [Spirosoma endophyticum]SFE65217.1 polysaccharide transporter, PST family [Spirosoma endophyticum]
MVSDQVTSAVETEQETAKTLSRATLKRFAINVVSLFSVNVANMLLPLLTVPYVVRIIGPERLGLLNFSQAYVAYFTLLINYGFEMSAVRTIAANRTDKALVNRTFSEVIAGKTLLWILSTLVFAGITWFTPDFRSHIVLHTCTYITCIGVVLFPIWIYQAMEDLGRVAMFNLGVKILFTLSVFLLIRQPDDYIYQNLSISVAQVVVSVVALYVALRRFDLTFTWPSIAQLITRFREDSTLFFSSVMITLYAGSTVFLLGLLGNAYDVGIFSAGSRLEGIARSFVSLGLNQAFFPIVASAFGSGREDGLRVVRTTFFPLVAFMTVVSLVLWVIAPVFITLFYGDKFHDAILVLRIVSLLPILIGVSNLLGLHTMLNLRMDKAFFRITAIGSVVGLALNSLLIQKMGFIGAAYAWVAAEAYIALSMYVYLRSKGVQVVQLAYMREAISFSKNRLAILFKQR